jgi:formylglycine-generating enzyme
VRAPRLALAAVLSLASCEDAEARPQWLVHLSTDAPLPGFGDRLRIDVLDEDGALCATCSRVFDTGGDALPLSFGIEPREDGAPRFLRARLYRAENTDDAGEPDGPMIDLLGALPPLGDGLTEVRATLGLTCFGRPADVASLKSCDPDTGEALAAVVLELGDSSTLPAPGSFAGGDVPCGGDAPDGMVCIPGGTFLMGSRSFIPFGPAFDPVPEQLVQLSPFWLDVAELDIQTARDSVAKAASPPTMRGLANPDCLYTLEPGDDELASVNCVNRQTAAELCEKQGKRLPTEAEWEFAAVARTNDAPYPWKPAGPVTTKEICEHAIVARGAFNDSTSRLCVLAIDAEVGPVTGGAPLDVTELGVRNMAGNMGEWVADDFSVYSDDICWGDAITLRKDPPSCTADATLGVLRGGDWEGITYNAHGFARRSGVTSAYAPNVGVRCARDIEQQDSE